jgi:hypothetical protein
LWPTLLEKQFGIALGLTEGLLRLSH